MAWKLVVTCFFIGHRSQAPCNMADEEAKEKEQVQYMVLIPSLLGYHIL